MTGREPMWQPGAGVHLLDEVSRGDLDSLVAWWRGHGWTVRLLEGGRDLDEVVVEVGRVWDFPDYYGANLDALADCLADLPGPSALVWTGWQDLSRRCPQDWADLIGVFTERAGLPPAFAVWLA